MEEPPKEVSERHVAYEVREELRAACWTERKRCACGYEVRERKSDATEREEWLRVCSNPNFGIYTHALGLARLQKNQFMEAGKLR
jgi:hypothetical protein